ncbi:ATP-binding cassette domain-containing protein, partial [Candidatus Bathyarchaeota archaeon]|nr:ATP-binding cassette domain-containing protein [Candidatus Bathyarchaeota archaeon]
RVILGIWPHAAGDVRIDGAAISHWNREELGPHLGYLPQDIELFSGTVAENIARFGEVESEKVIAAAKMAGVHELILELQQGYDTPIGQSGTVLSGGQRQRIGLARALYDEPKLVVLDEPNSNLDEKGEAALLQAVNKLQQNKATVLLITHRSSVLKSVNKMLVMREGALWMFGKRDEVIAELGKQKKAASNVTPLPSQTAK